MYDNNLKISEQLLYTLCLGGEGELVQGPREGVICHVPAVSVSLTNEPGRPFSYSFSHFLGVGVWGVRHREAGSGHTPLAVKSLIKIKTVDLIIQIFLSYLSPPPLIKFVVLSRSSFCEKTQILLVLYVPVFPRSKHVVFKQLLFQEVKTRKKVKFYVYSPSRRFYTSSRPDTASRAPAE